MHSGARSTAALRRTTAFMLPRHFSGIQCQIQLVKTGVLTSCPIYHISADLGSRGDYSLRFDAFLPLSLGGLAWRSKSVGPMPGRDLRRAMAVAAPLCTAGCSQGHAVALALHGRRGERDLSSVVGASVSAAEDAKEEGERRRATHRVRFKGHEVLVEHGETLRTALLRTGMATPHNGQAQFINCRGLGTCGTCAVEIHGDVTPSSWNGRERLRLSFPPHSAPGNESLRLACQVRVKGDLQVTKYEHFWGQGPSVTADRSFSAPFGELEFLLDTDKDQ